MRTAEPIMGALELDAISYSQDETIAVTRDYYDFLTKMYLPDSLILHPPKDGWPTIQGGIPGFEKNDTVLGLLRHLPYIRGEQESHGAGETLLGDWQELFTMRDYGDGLKICSEPGDYIDQPEAIPSSVIGLCYGGGNNECFLLDTDFGIIYYCESPYELDEEYSMKSVRDDPTRWSNEVEAEWRLSGGKAGLPGPFVISSTY
ncbi:hypothetical protein C1H76_1485 [Elsinoe australis]|uniref:SMI1/KNR4 family protein n=1 Tax=Elsinoe australis TaxID=40998 RepID=A0A4U7B471_9PEZI|nr:hypothetical protein C1H76_1485 [Elsinoe australis]